MHHHRYTKAGCRGQGPGSRHRFRHGHSGRGGLRARRGDVRAAILALLADRPMHGYEMIKELESRSGGAWRPSPGSVYPTLQLLEDEGLIRGEDADGTRRFVLTDSGQEAASAREGDAPWEQVSSGIPSEHLKLGRSARQLSSAVGQVFTAATPEQAQRIAEVLDAARRDVYGVLSETEAPETDAED